MLVSDSRVDKELQQNKIVDVFFDDWDRLSDGNTDFAAKSEKHLKVAFNSIGFLIPKF